MYIQLDGYFIILLIYLVVSLLWSRKAHVYWECAHHTVYQGIYSPLVAPEPHICLQLKTNSTQIIKQCAELYSLTPLIFAFHVQLNVLLFYLCCAYIPFKHIHFYSVFPLLISKHSTIDSFYWCILDGYASLNITHLTEWVFTHTFRYIHHTIVQTTNRYWLPFSFGTLSSLVRKDAFIPFVTSVCFHRTRTVCA